MSEELYPNKRQKMEGASGGHRITDVSVNGFLYTPFLNLVSDQLLHLLVFVGNIQSHVTNLSTDPKKIRICGPFSIE